MADLNLESNVYLHCTYRVMNFAFPLPPIITSKRYQKQDCCEYDENPKFFGQVERVLAATVSYLDVSHAHHSLNIRQSALVEKDPQDPSWYVFLRYPRTQQQWEDLTYRDKRCWQINQGKHSQYF